MIGKGDGDRDARFDEIYRKYFGRVLRYFLRCRVADGEAQELAQDTFLRLYEHMDQMRSEHPWSYVQKIARTVMLNRVRARKTQKRDIKLVDIDDPELAIDVAGPDAPDYADRQEAALRRGRLRAAIRELPPGQAECLRLRLGDMEYENIGKILEISVDAVKSRLRDAKRQLRKRLLPGAGEENEK